MALDIKAMTTIEGVAALRDMVKQLDHAALNLSTSANAVKTVVDSEMNSLGPYQESYEDMMSFAHVAIMDASDDIDSLKKRLTQIANNIEDWLNNQKPTDTTGGSTSGSDDWPGAPVEEKKKVR